MAAAASGNSQVFVEELGEGVFAQRVEELLTERFAQFARETGQPAVASVSLGSVPIDDDGTIVSGIRLRNGRGDASDISLWWRSGELVGLDDRAFEMSFTMAPTSDTHFVGYHLGFAKVLPMEFVVGEEGRVTNLRIGPHGAIRLGGFGHEGHDHGEGDEGRDDHECGDACEHEGHDH
jgi:hypothetical protein